MMFRLFFCTGPNRLCAGRQTTSRPKWSWMACGSRAMTTSSTAGQSVSLYFPCASRSLFLDQDRALMCSEITSGRLTNAGPFIEDDEEPDIQRRIAGRQISWNILHELNISTTGT